VADERVEALEREVEALRDRSLRLAVCKLPDPRHPYFDSVVQSGVTPDERSRHAPVRGLRAALSSVGRAA
jgi:hypothetical protein